MAREQTLAIVTDEAARTMVANIAGVGSITLYLDRIHENNMRHAAFHGLKQRIVDAAARSRDPKTGAPAPAKEKFDAVARVIEHLNSGADRWDLRAEGRGSAEDVILVNALMEARGVEAAKAVEFVGKRSAAEKRALMESAALKPIVDRLRAERVGTVDTDSLLEELG